MSFQAEELVHSDRGLHLERARVGYLKARSNPMCDYSLRKLYPAAASKLPVSGGIKYAAALHSKKGAHMVPDHSLALKDEDARDEVGSAPDAFGKVGFMRGLQAVGD
jgi:hypothetical protein